MCAMIRNSSLGWRHKKKYTTFFFASTFFVVVMIMKDVRKYHRPAQGLHYNFTYFAVPAKDPEIVEMLKEQQCKIPIVNPYNPEILSHLVPSKMEKCRVVRYGVVRDGVLYLRADNVQSASLYYIRRVDDFSSKMSDPITLVNAWEPSVDIQYPIKEEFFKLMLFFNYEKHEEYHGAFPKTKEHEVGKTKSEDQVNIILLLFDSVAHAHAQRSLSKTYKYLLDHPRTTIMHGLSIVGDGTTAQLCALFTGKPEKELPEARRGRKNSKPVDDWPFIFKDMHHLGYKTLYSEEYQHAGTFQYRLKGFVNKPTTHYALPLWLMMQDYLDGNGVSCHHQFNFDYLNSFMHSYREHNKFAFIFNALTHNQLHLLENADLDILNFYKQFSRTGDANNTVVILMGDHGLRASTFRSMLHGKLEERLPFMSITLPPSFDKYTEELANLKRNAHLMTSHFDTHATLQHLLTFPKLNPKVKNKFGKSLFTDIVKLNRTCGHAGVDKQWCTCLNYEQIDPSTDPNVSKLLQTIISYINNLHQSEVNGSCAILKLKRIINVSRRTSSTEVNQFVKSETADGGCDSCVAKYNKDSKVSRYEYEINFSVLPSSGTYEAVGEVVYKEDGGVHVMHSSDISRTNMYRNQPKCIADRYPHLRKFCYCV